MSYASLVQTLKGGVTSGNFGHAGRKGKIGGSAPVATLPAGLIPGMPAGAYDVVYDATGKTHSKARAMKIAAGLGAGHVAVAINGNHYVINTHDPNVKPFYGIHGDILGKVPTKFSQHPDVVAMLGQQAAASPAQVAAKPIAAKKPASKVEEAYNNATQEAKDFADKYGLLAEDANALKYLQEMTTHDYNKNRSALLTREQAYKANNQQHRNKQYMNASVDGKVHASQSDAERVRYMQANSYDYETKRLSDPLGRGSDGYVTVPNGTKVKSLSKADMTKPDFNTMASLKTQPSSEVAKHQSHMDKHWNHYDNGQIKAKVANAFDITMPQTLHDEFTAKKAKYGNTKFLYHGTDTIGASGIIRMGHFVGDRPKIGRIHGNGIYLADQESKSVQYAHGGAGSKLSNSKAVVFISQAAMGKEVKSQYSSDGSKGGSDTDLKDGVDAFIKTSSGDPYKSNGYSTEYIVRDPGAIQPRVWLDIERSPR